MFKRLVFLCFFPVYLFAQVAPTNPNLASSVATASPTANAFNRGNQIPVNHFTGIPQISIPIYSYSGPNLNHSIALNYFAGGMKVEEVAGNTGLGWSLLAGGVITRSVQGLPDDQAGVGWLNTGEVNPSTAEYSSSFSPSSPPNRDEFYMDQVDSQWDIFQFSAGDLSGRFHLGKDQTVLISPTQRITIQYTVNPSLDVLTGMPAGSISASTIESFTITDETGARYIFSEREVTNVRSTLGGSNFYNRAHVSAWYLTSVIAPFNEDTISITYQNVSTTNFGRVHSNFYDCTSCSGSLGDVWSSLGQSTTFVAGKRIKTINFPDRTYIDFVYDGTSRCDLQGDHALRQINIWDSQLRSGFLLDYLYFGSNGDMAYGSCVGVTNNHRLQLKSVTPYTPAVTSVPYVFHYTQSSFPPSITSFAQDHWGGYNGQRTNSVLVPTAPGVTSGANRNADSRFSSTASLQSIQYPTGGRTVFEFEPNERLLAVESSISRTMGLTNPTPQTATFQKQITGFPTLFTFTMAGAENWSSTNVTCNLQITITALNGATPVATDVTVMSRGAARAGFRKYINIPASTTSLSISAIDQGSCPTGSRFSVQVAWVNETGLASRPESLTGGIRIRRISDFDCINQQPVSVREFRYLDNLGRSSGFINARPEYTTTNVTEQQSGSSFIRSNYRNNLSMPVNPQHYAQGSPIGYAQVEEIFGTPENNLGRNVYEFTTYNSDLFIAAMNQNFPPYLTNQMADWLLGLPLRVRQFGADNVLLSEQTTEYQNNPQNTVLWPYKALKLLVTNERYLTGNSNTQRAFRDNYFYPSAGTVFPIRTVSIDYRNGDSIRSETIYNYDHTHLVPVRKVIRSNKKLGEEIEELTYYPFHYTGINTGPIQTLKTRGILQPISTEVWINDAAGRRLLAADISELQTVNGMVKEFRDHSLESAAPIPQGSIGVFNPSTLVRNSSLIVPQTEQSGYNQRGLVQEVRDIKTGLYTSVLYDYFGYRATARIVNARINQIAYSSFETGEQGGWSYSGSTVADPVRSVMGRRYYQLNTGAISKADIPIGNPYVVSFWMRNGTASVSGASLIKSETNSLTGWTYFEYQVSGSSSVGISGNGHIDELRLYPVAASMVTENTDYLLGIISTCDANNRMSYQEYDGLNRPFQVRDQDYNIVSSIAYQFASGDCSVSSMGMMGMMGMMAMRASPNELSATGEKSESANREANWADVNPLVIECEKTQDEKYFTGRKIKLQEDINPASLSYGAKRWTATVDGKETCLIEPDWQPTGNYRCSDKESAVEGRFMLTEVKDVNPLSKSYGNLMYQKTGNPAICPEENLVIELQIRNIKEAAYKGGVRRTAEIYAVVSGKNGLQKVSANGLMLKYKISTSTEREILEEERVKSFGEQQEVLLYMGVISDQYSAPKGSDGSTYNVSVKVIENIGYTIKPSTKKP